MDSILPSPPEQQPGGRAVAGDPAGAVDDRWYAVPEIPEQPQWKCLNRWQLYDAIARGDLRAARLGAGRRRLIVRGRWVTEYLERAAEAR